MKALLDTHTFLWWITDDARLSPAVRRFIGDGQNRLFFSAASGWEVAVKVRLGRLNLPGNPVSFLPAQLTRNAIDVLPVQLSHALQVYVLPDHHPDLFDRLLIAQSQVENLPLLTADPSIAQYGVDTIW
jgi:PIN domain nuclease of toxin-antitoxin system